jgi:heme exporter protein A
MINCPAPLSVSQISFHYPSRELTLHADPLLHRISLTLAPGNLLHLQGPNGSGKTSLLKLLAGLLRPESGYISYDNQDIWSNIAMYQQQISYLGHKNGFNPGLTVWEHAQLDWWSDQHSIHQSLHDLDLWSVKDKLGAVLSAGQKRRVALLRLLLSPTQLWLLDEPLVGLDTQGIAFLLACLEQHVRKGGQIVYTSHQPLLLSTADHQEYVLCSR